MQLLGSTFFCEVPDGWAEAREPGCVIATAPASVLGFTPNAVLRESRVEGHPDTLAAISQANLRAFGKEAPGTLVVRVEAVRCRGVEHRRIWTLSPVTNEEIHGNILCLLSIQELAVVDGVVAELTVTLPLVGWSPGDQHETIAESLAAMPVAERTAPPTESNVPPVVLDEWATTYDGAPREDLSVITPPVLVLQAEPIVLSDEASTIFLNSARTRVFPPVTGEVRKELAAAELVDDDGNLSSAGFWYVDHVLSGEAWKIRVAAPKATEFRFWITDSTTMFVVPHPELGGRKFLGYCPSNDLFRLLLAWVEAFPSWPFDMHLELSRAELQAKLEQNVTPGLHVGGVGEFVEQRWTYMSLSDGFDEPVLNWVHAHTRRRGELGQSFPAQHPTSHFHSTGSRRSVLAASGRDHRGSRPGNGKQEEYMTYYKVNAPACNSIFSKVEGECSNASTAHTSVSGDIDTLGSLCTGKSAKLAARLNAVYNRVLTAGMTGAEQQITDAVAGGRSAVAAIQAGDHEMADQTERAANIVDEVRITDGKNV